MRAEQLATLTKLRHQRLSSDELGRALDAVEAELGDEDDLARDLVRMTRREWDKARRVPAELRDGDRAHDLTRRERLGAGARQRRLRHLSPPPRARRRAASAATSSASSSTIRTTRCSTTSSRGW